MSKNPAGNDGKHPIQAPHWYGPPMYGAPPPNVNPRYNGPYYPMYPPPPNVYSGAQPQFLPPNNMNSPSNQSQNRKGASQGKKEEITKPNVLNRGMETNQASVAQKQFANHMPPYPMYPMYPYPPPYQYNLVQNQSLKNGKETEKDAQNSVSSAASPQTGNSTNNHPMYPYPPHYQYNPVQKQALKTDKEIKKGGESNVASSAPPQIGNVNNNHPMYPQYHPNAPYPYPPYPNFPQNPNFVQQPIQQAHPQFQPPQNSNQGLENNNPDSIDDAFSYLGFEKEKDPEVELPGPLNETSNEKSNLADEKLDESNEKAETNGIKKGNNPPVGGTGGTNANPNPNVQNVNSVPDYPVGWYPYGPNYGQFGHNPYPDPNFAQNYPDPQVKISNIDQKDDGDDDDDFGQFESAAPILVQNSTKNNENRNKSIKKEGNNFDDDDDFGEFESASASNSNSKAQVIEFDQVSDTFEIEDEFGEFESADKTPEQTKDKQDETINSNIDNNNNSDNNNNNNNNWDPEFDDDPPLEKSFEPQSSIPNEDEKINDISKEEHENNIDKFLESNFERAFNERKLDEKKSIKYLAKSGSIKKEKQNKSKKKPKPAVKIESIFDNLIVERSEDPPVTLEVDPVQTNIDKDNDDKERIDDVNSKVFFEDENVDLDKNEPPNQINSVFDVPGADGFDDDGFDDDDFGDFEGADVVDKEENNRNNDHEQNEKDIQSENLKKETENVSANKYDDNNNNNNNNNNSNNNNNNNVSSVTIEDDNDFEYDDDGFVDDEFGDFESAENDVGGIFGLGGNGGGSVYSGAVQEFEKHVEVEDVKNNEMENDKMDEITEEIDDVDEEKGKYGDNVGRIKTHEDEGEVGHTDEVKKERLGGNMNVNKNDEVVVDDSNVDEDDWDVEWEGGVEDSDVEKGNGNDDEKGNGNDDEKGNGNDDEKKEHEDLDKNQDDEDINIEEEKGFVDENDLINQFEESIQSSKSKNNKNSEDDNDNNKESKEDEKDESDNSDWADFESPVEDSEQLKEPEHEIKNENEEIKNEDIFKNLIEEDDEPIIEFDNSGLFQNSSENKNLGVEEDGELESNEENIKIKIPETLAETLIFLIERERLNEAVQCRHQIKLQKEIDQLKTSLKEKVDEEAWDEVKEISERSKNLKEQLKGKANEDQWRDPKYRPELHNSDGIPEKWKDMVKLVKRIDKKQLKGFQKEFKEVKKSKAFGLNAIKDITELDRDLLIQNRAKDFMRSLMGSKNIDRLSAALETELKFEDENIGPFKDWKDILVYSLEVMKKTDTVMQIIKETLEPLKNLLESDDMELEQFTSTISPVKNQLKGLGEVYLISQRIKEVGNVIKLTARQEIVLNQHSSALQSFWNQLSLKLESEPLSLLMKQLNFKLDEIMPQNVIEEDLKNKVSSELTSDCCGICRLGLSSNDQMDNRRSTEIRNKIYECNGFSYHQTCWNLWVKSSSCAEDDIPPHEKIPHISQTSLELK